MAWYSLSIIPIIIIILKEIREMIINIKEIDNQLLYASAPISKVVPILVQNNEETRFKKDRMGKIIATNKKIKYNLKVVNRLN
jgi:hypothetical protein